MGRRSGMAWSTSAQSLFTMSAQRLRNRQVSSPATLCEDVQLKDEHMSHSFGNNIEIRHRSLGAIAEFEQSGGDRSP